MTSGLGVEILDLDLAEPQPGEVVRSVRAAWIDHRLVLLRGQQLDAAAQLAFARWFGIIRPPERYVHPDLPQGAVFSHLSNVLEDGTGGTEEVLRHQDKSFETPLRGICLYALEVPPVGGETGFIDAARAYERLDADLQAELNGLFATHRARKGVNRIASAGSPMDTSVLRTDHPVILRHPETRRPILFVNERNTARIVGLDEPRSEALLSRLLWSSTMTICIICTDGPQETSCAGTT